MGTRCYEVGAIRNGELQPMSNIPLHVQRRFEQRWVSRFTRPAAANAPKNVGTKATPLMARRPQQSLKKNPPA
jgi:hypothetical protein